MKLIRTKHFFQAVIISGLAFIISCMSPSEPSGVKTRQMTTLPTGGYCKDVIFTEEYIIAAADENGYKVFSYEITGNHFEYEDLYGSNDINSDGEIDKIRDVVLSNKLNQHDTPLFFSMDYNDAIYYHNVNYVLPWDYQVPADGASNREKVRAFTIDDSQPDHIIMYVLMEEALTNSSFISIRNLDVQNNFDSTIVFWGAGISRYDGLSSNTDDIYYADSLVYVANSQLGVQVFKQETNESLSLFSEFDGIQGEVSEIFANDGIIYAGLNDDKGCYMALLDSDGEIITTLEIAEGYTVQGIDKINNVLALACGSDGILLYDILQSTDNLYANEIGRVETEYAYQVKLMSENSFLAATRAGVQYYSLDY
ncbi:MAG: hypothetical protein HN729_10535 [Candidatus Marinimicrobia bacterium]|jgi:hypothetical protein|nr:hypothetical protein [Candidatus Neomarinimicrobiota bacterium]MBT3634087.1 hypothetical protein [Candidatus Neomarinimicrobiota bacterium]MBT3683039.1 hypothetical protein [Candidatus Neomarinimicrobiota bacterium]MBT3759869.1 hypothetical protein [Candidatus Neomarinimicrobiota bacterium]MBT3895678.1 hypothetical protein [Candidatus Neomarinimicrobiota bacterium]